MSGRGDVPHRRGPTVTTDRHDPRHSRPITGARPPRAADVVRAREGARNAGVTYGPRARRRGPGDTWHDFTARYGWRAYALPVLLVITVAALLTTNEAVRKHVGITGTAKHGTVHIPPVATGSIALKDDAPSGNVNETVLRAAALPPGAPYTRAGDGTFRILAGQTPVIGQGQLYRYSVEVENGIDDIDLSHFAKTVVQVLSDSRSWSGHGVALRRVDSGPVDFRVSLTSSKTVRKLCGYSIPVETSCYAPAGSVAGLDVNRVVFNDARWARGSTAYVGDLAAYRIYMINHEDGHALGHQHAHQCLPGGLAPVMMQQTFGLRSATTDKMCEANPWPYPPGAKGVPGPEQQDTPANDEYGLGD
jgi:hypothetical protein